MYVYLQQNKRSVNYTPLLFDIFNGHIMIVHIPGVSRLVDITAGGDFLVLCDQTSSYKHVSYLDVYGVMTV